jgi:hypothetical protein
VVILSGRTGVSLMPIEGIDDWAERVARHDAFWEREIIDRPAAYLVVDRPEESTSRLSTRPHATARDWWMDFGYRAEKVLADIAATDYVGDALPQTYPFLGPEVFSAFFGCEMEYADHETSWSVPNLLDWAEVDGVRFSEENVYWRKVLEFTDVLLEAGKGRFYTGITDLHPGGDALAAFRDPQRLNLDLVDAVDDVKALLRYTEEIYREVYDTYHRKLVAAGQAITTWMPICSTRKWYVSSNDFSCMVSKRMFDDVFLPGLIDEFRHYEACIYHLDGPGAIRHLDSLLDVPELNAIQWVPGAGRGGPVDWIWLYQRCQAARKGLEIAMDVSDLEALMEALRPEGLFLHMWGFADREHAEATLRRLDRWR